MGTATTQGRNRDCILKSRSDRTSERFFLCAFGMLLNLEMSVLYRPVRGNNEPEGTNVDQVGINAKVQ